MIAPGSQSALAVAVRLGIFAIFLWLIWMLVRPFAGLLIWSAILAVALYPLFTWIRKRLFGSGIAAAILVTLVALLLVFGPVALLCASLIVSLEALAVALQDGHLARPALPAVLDRLPFLTEWLGDLPAANVTRIETYLKAHGHALIGPGRWALHVVEELARSVTVFAISVVAAGFLFIPGPMIAARIRGAAARISGPSGGRFTDLAVTTIRNVARGVIGIALLEAIVIGTVLIVMQIPHAGLLTLAALVLSISQIGTGVVLVPIALWAYFADGLTTGLAVLLTTIPITLIDLTLKPLAVGQGMEAPTAVIFLGVIGGTVAFGIPGLFLGPMLLVLGFEMFQLWNAEEGVEGASE